MNLNNSFASAATPTSPIAGTAPTMLTSASNFNYPLDNSEKSKLSDYLLESVNKFSRGEMGDSKFITMLKKLNSEFSSAYSSYRNAREHLREQIEELKDSKVVLLASGYNISMMKVSDMEEHFKECQQIMMTTVFKKQPSVVLSSLVPFTPANNFIMNSIPSTLNSSSTATSNNTVHQSINTSNIKRIQFKPQSA